MKVFVYFLISFLAHLLIYGFLTTTSKPLDAFSSQEITVVEIGPQKISQKEKLPAKSRIPVKAQSESYSGGETQKESESSLQGGSEESVQAPRLLKETVIKYPKQAQSAGIEGVVELQLTIDTQGRVQEAQVLKGPGYGLNEAALNAMKEFVFSPALRQGERVSARIIYKYRFVLR